MLTGSYYLAAALEHRSGDDDVCASAHFEAQVVDARDFVQLEAHRLHPDDQALARQRHLQQVMQPCNVPDATDGTLRPNKPTAS